MLQGVLDQVFAVRFQLVNSTSIFRTEDSTNYGDAEKG